MDAPKSSLVNRHQAALLNTFGATRLGLVRGEGIFVWDEEGRRYADFLGGIATNVVGYAHPTWVRAVADQAAQMAHVSNFFATPAQVELAEKLLEITAAPTGARVFFANSGTEANEAALKLARKHRGPGKFVALAGGFHGRSMGALSVTAKTAIREPFEPLPSEVEFVPAGDLPALQSAVTADTAAIILEPIQGEVGVQPVGLDFLQLARKLADKTGALLIFDEVQTGIARTGEWFSFQQVGVTPDVITLAKGLGGGFPIGAMVVLNPNYSSIFAPGDHGSTFGGNPLACAAALATLEIIEAENLRTHTKSIGNYLADGLRALPEVTEVRGTGLLLGVGLAAPVAAEVVAAAQKAGFILNATNSETLRLCPPLTVTAAEVDDLLQALGPILRKLCDAHPVSQ